MWNEHALRGILNATAHLETAARHISGRATDIWVCLLGFLGSVPGYDCGGVPGCGG